MICYLVVSTALLGSPHVMPEMWLARDEATLARVAASRGPGGAWLEFIDLKRGRIGNGEVRRRWSKSKGKSRQRDEDTEVAPSKSRRATPTKVRAEVVGVSVPDTPEGIMIWPQQTLATRRPALNANNRGQRRSFVGIR